MRKKKSIFDMDDVLWDLNEKVCSMLGLDPNIIVSFRIHQNPFLSDAEKKAVYDAYRDPYIFRDIVWYDGVKRLNTLHEYGIDDYINSNCTTKEIRDIKMEQLRSVLTIPEDHIILNVVMDNTYIPKPIKEDVYYFIDDSPHNVAGSLAKMNIMPRKPWNMYPGSMDEAYGKKVMHMDSLNNIIDYIIAA